MAEMKKNWKLSAGWRGEKPEGYPFWLLNILENRGAKTKVQIESFLNPKYEELIDPFTFSNMEAAVKRVAEAKKKNEKIVVYGDYDVDGICATAVMIEALNKIGIQNVESYIPHREEEGYGLNEEAISEIIKNRGNLIISVDCGVTSKDLIDKFYTEIDFIVCDHHEIDAKKLPQKAVVLHPALVKPKNQKQNFCAAGMAFYFARAIQMEFTDLFLQGQEKWLLDLVAMATICDVIPLVGQNRILAKWGILVLTKTKRAGLLELAKAAQVDISGVGSYHIGFILGPRLNAAGRLQHAKSALELLLTQDKKEAQQIAGDLNSLNIERQEMCNRILEEARAEIEQTSKKEKAVLLLSNKTWPRGVVGIIASRISEEYSRPAIIFENDGKQLHGSARSVEGFDITAALSSCSNYLLRFGGHAKAAGLAVAEEHFLTLEEDLVKIAKKQIKTVQLAPTVNIDTQIKVEEITEETIDILNKLEPFGYGNSQPVFMVAKANLTDFKWVGSEKQHLKFNLKTSAQSSKQISGVWFNAPKIKEGEYEICFTLRYNFWNNRKSIELRAIDARIPE